MTRQTSVNLTPATEAQVEFLKAQGHGPQFTDLVRVAIDRMAQQEGYTVIMTEQQVIEAFRSGHSRAIAAAGSGSYPQITDFWYVGMERGGHLVEYVVANGRTMEERGALYFDK